jgi:hypothetical protein
MNIYKLLYKGIFKTIIISLFLQGLTLKAEVLTVTENLINFNSREVEKLLINSTAKQDYIPLSINFVTQKNLAYCGVASMVMVLNALPISAPSAPEYNSFSTSYPIFTQSNIFNQETEQIITATKISRQGMTLEELGKFLGTYPVKTEVYHAENLNIAQFRQLIVKNLQESSNFILVNYLRNNIGQQRGGHISPLAAYDQETDRFLILDVARYKYPPVWVKVEELWQAVNTIDSVSGKTRGFVSISLD